MTSHRTRSLLGMTAMAAGLFMVIEPYPAAFASTLGATRSAIGAPDRSIEDVAVRGGFARRGNININRSRGVNRNINRNVNRNVNRHVNVNRSVNRTVVRTGNWVRPGRYWWRPGGAIAAGAAIGFVTAATAVAWAGAAPGPNMCWYYTDASRREGFWDACP